MPDRRAPGTIEPDRHPGEAPGNNVTEGAPSDRRVFRPRNAVSFLLAFVVLYLVYRELLGLDWREV